jgi:hypothetical protein
VSPVSRNDPGGELENGASYPGLEIILKQAMVLEVAPMGAVGSRTARAASQAPLTLP